MGKKRTELLNEAQNASAALRVADRKARRAKAAFETLEKILKPIRPRLETWASMPISDDAQTRGVLSVGECRQLLEALKAFDKDEADEESQGLAA